LVASVVNLDWKYCGNTPPMCMPQVRGVLVGIGCSYTKITECKKLVRDNSNII